MRIMPTLAVALVLSVGALAQTPPAAPKAVNVTGKWAMNLEMSIGSGTPALDLKQDGEKLTGTYTGRYGASKLEGKVGADRKIAFTVTVDADGTPAVMRFSGEIAADGATMGGGGEIEGLGEVTWRAKKNIDK